MSENQSKLPSPSSNSPPSGSSRKTVSSIEISRAVATQPSPSWSHPNRPSFEPVHSPLSFRQPSPTFDFGSDDINFDPDLSLSSSVPIDGRIPTDIECRSYYNGIPSHPLLIATLRLSHWSPVSSLDSGYGTSKQLYAPLAGHPLQPSWQDYIVPRFVAILEQEYVGAFCLDVVKIGETEELARMVIWFGVPAGTLDPESGLQVVQQCTSILIDEGCHDVDVEIRETTVIRSAALYEPRDSRLPVGDLVTRYSGKFQNAIGLPISSAASPYSLGTSGVCLIDPKRPNRHYMLTAHHVVGSLQEQLLPTEPLGSEISLFTSHDLQLHIENISQAIEDMRDFHHRRTGKPPSECREANDLELARATITGDWQRPEDRLLGKAFAYRPHSHGIGGVTPYTRDYALIELNPDIADWASHNRLDLRDRSDFVMVKSFPQLGPALGVIDASLSLTIAGIVQHEQLSESIAVLKRGSATGLTFGKTGCFQSFLRCNIDDSSYTDSWELPVISASQVGLRQFSQGGDSGAAVIARDGQVVGLLTGGSGKELIIDITYVTPMYWILVDMRSMGLEMFLA